MVFTNSRVLHGAVLLLLSFPGTLHAQTRWVGSWAAAQQLPEPRNALATDDLRDATLRQIIHLSIGGPEIRVRVSNRFGHAPLEFRSVHIAKPASSASSRIDPATDKALTFSGSAGVIIPAGADYLSDPVAFPVAALSDLAITLHINDPPAEQTGHPGSRATSYLVHGDRVAATELTDARKIEHWYFISGVDVAAHSPAASIVVLGDSITDGHGATTDANNRWPDVLAVRLQAATQSPGVLGVLNQGIGGNRLLLDGLGPNALARFDHDVVAQSGARYLIVLEGVNDLGTLTRDGEVPREQHDLLVRRIIAAYQQIIARAHAHGVDVFGATILPYTGSQYYHPGPSSEADRQAVNAWIRAPGHFDAVIDFDKVIRDPQHPEQMLAAYDSGDHLHPSPAGYAAMAESVPLSLFAAPAQPASAPKIALTFDDLPAHGPLPPGVTRAQIASKILGALKDAQVPATYGFVNGLGLEQKPGDVAVLEAWRAAGYPLGNHTWSHMDLRKQAVESFEADVNQNEPLLDKWMTNQDWHWFRYPFLAEGETKEKRASIRSFLGQRGYRIAGVTMSFGDYQWNEPYARCRVKGDTEAVAFLESSFLAAADESIRYYRGLSSTLYGRDVAYVLLLHVGAFDAVMMPRLLELYESRGFTFVTLSDAERDEFYREDTDLHLPPGPDTLEEAMAERHLSLPPRAAFAPQLEALCR